MPRIFVSQQRVHQWTEEGRVSVDGNVMNLPELGRTFRLTEAFYIERVVSEGGDAYKLTGRVKTRAQIASLGGEVFLNSLIIGDAAYEGDPGFVGEAVAGARAAASAPGTPAAAGASRTGRPDGPSRPGQAATPLASQITAPPSRDKPSLLGMGPPQGPGLEVPRKHS